MWFCLLCTRQLIFWKNSFHSEEFQKEITVFVYAGKQVFFLFFFACATSFQCEICLCARISKKQQWMNGRYNQNRASFNLSSRIFFLCIWINVHLLSYHTEDRGGVWASGAVINLIFFYVPASLLSVHMWRLLALCHHCLCWAFYSFSAFLQASDWPMSRDFWLANESRTLYRVYSAWQWAHAVGCGQDYRARLKIPAYVRTQP